MGEGTEQKDLGARVLNYLIRQKADIFFKVLRNTKPIFALPKNGPVFITRFNDVQEVLSRPGIFRVTYAPMMDPSVGPFMLGRDETTINQRDKGIMRSLIQREDLPHVRDLVTRLTAAAVEPHLGIGKIDVVGEVSRTVPVKLTGEYFGFPGPDEATMKRWSRAAQYDMFHNTDNVAAIHEANIAAGREMTEYMQELVPQRRQELENNPAMDDTLSRLLKSRFVEAIEFDESRIITNILGTLVGGIETTSAAVVQILDQLFKRPDVLASAIAAAKKDDDQEIYAYCWEALRFNPINPFVVRYCAQDYKVASGTLRGTRINAGRTVLVSTRSAMRDGRELDYANAFRIDRPDYHYMHMGYGLHTCLGDQVSRVQVPAIVKRLLTLPNVRPEGDIDFKDGPFPESYVVTFG